MYLYGESAGGAAQSGGFGAMLIPMIIIFVIFYFLLIMPQKKKQKKHQEMMNTLKGGERVVTSGGIYGTVTRVMDDRVEIEVDKNARIQVSKSSVSGLINPEQAQSKS